jgi:hypothetical protein
MNRDGQEPPEGAQAEAPDNIIAFPGARVRAVPVAAPEEGQAAEPQPTEERPTDDQGMTLDAFERAVRSAVREKLGDAPDGSRPQGADELVAQVFSALTGKDPKTALSEVRQRLSEPQPPADDPPEGDVIDLGAVREARQRATIESAQKIGGAIKDTLGQFIANIAQRQGMSGEVTLDAGFFKQHGSALLGNLFQGLASALMQQNATRAPATPPPEAPTAAPNDDASPEATAAPNADATGAPTTEPGPATPPEARQVQVKLDLGSILAGLFRRREPPPEPK